MQVVVAEKPSVAKSIAKVLGANRSKDGYMEGNGYRVTWCVGHLVELVYPAAYDERYKKWQLELLPIMPEKWKYGIKGDTKSQYDVVKSLFLDAATESVVCATDAGREGELIFRNVYMKTGCKKPIKRLWISSMENSAIRQGFEALKDGTQYENLYSAAQARERADWLTGMNLSRLFTLVYGGGKKITIGRVLTPTLAMICERDAQIDGFTKKKFYQIHLKNQKGIDFVSEKFENQEEAAKVFAECTNGTLCISSVKKERKKQQPPLLYDLTTLQQECNKMFGYSANKTLEIAQELYEKKLTTYPRTDAKYITEDMMDTFLDVLDLAQDHADYADTRCIDRKLVKRVIDNSKVTDHHAIIITKDQTNLKDLSQDSRMVYDLIVLRILSAVSMPYEYYSISADGICNRHEFSMNGVTVIDYGFKANEMKFRNRSKADKEENAEKIMPDISEGDVLQVTPELSEQWTKPPAHYTEASLLGAMDKAGNKEMSDEVERKGLGTSATRAAIIEKLITNGYVERVKKKIVATEAGKYLISVVPDRVKSVSMTCDWENELVEVAAGTKDYAAFMNETEDYIKSLVDEYSKVEPKPWQSQREEICKCPVCGNSVQEGKFGIFCAGKCGLIFSFYKEKLSAKQIKTLLVDNKEVLMKDQTSSKGTKYDIYIKYHGYEPFTYTDKDGHERNAYTMKFDTRFPKNNKKKG